MQHLMSHLSLDHQVCQLQTRTSLSDELARLLESDLLPCTTFQNLSVALWCPLPPASERILPMPFGELTPLLAIGLSAVIVQSMASLCPMFHLSTSPMTTPDRRTACSTG